MGNLLYEGVMNQEFSLYPAWGGVAWGWGIFKFPSKSASKKQSVEKSETGQQLARCYSRTVSSNVQIFAQS